MRQSYSFQQQATLTSYQLALELTPKPKVSFVDKNLFQMTEKENSAGLCNEVQPNAIQPQKYIRDVSSPISKTPMSLVDKLCMYSPIETTCHKLINYSPVFQPQISYLNSGLKRVKQSSQGKLPYFKSNLDLSTEDCINEQMQ